MPYIPQDKRKELEDKMEDLFSHINSSELSIGEINFIISSILNKYMKASNFNYALCNSLIGVLECAKLELYRKVVAEYEEVKISQNGSLY